MQRNRASETDPDIGTATGAETETIELWSAAGIVAWSILFTPAFGAWLQMYNYRRLGEHDKAAQAWRWCLAGLAVLAWNALASAVGHRLGIDTPLFDWLNAAMFIVWTGATLPAHENALSKCGKRNAPRRWDSVVILGMAAAVAYLGASTLLCAALVTLT